ncbi:MAG: ABC transporter permease [Planctomycetota bacterium]
MTANPIIRRELLSGLRRPKALVMQAGFLAAVAVLVLLYWPAGGYQDISGQVAQDLFGTLAVGQMVLVVLFAPAFTAASLTSEREHNTLESLFATTMRPGQIATGKMVGSLGLLLLIVLSGVPALALPFLLGGLAGWQIFAVLGVLLLTALYLGMIGLLVSAVMHRSYRAIIVTYAVLLVVCFLLALPATPLSGHLLQRKGHIWQSVWHVLASLSPIEAMLSLVWREHSWAGGAAHMPPFWAMFLPIAGVTAVATTLVCLVKMRRPAPPPRPREKLKIVERGQISARSFLFVIDPRKRKKMISWWQNPMLIKEFRTRPMLQAQWLLRAVLWCLVAAVALMIVQAMTVTATLPERPSVQIITQDIPVVIAALSVLVLVLVGPAITGGTLCSDRESGVWDLIRTTRLPSWRIVTGKLQAAVIPLLLLVVAIVPTLLILPLLVDFTVNLWPVTWRVVQVVLMTAAFVAVAGMFFSGLCQRTATATAWTYGLVITLTLLTLLMRLGAGRFGHRVVATVFTVSPLAAALDAADSDALGRYPGLMGRHLTVMAGVVAVMLAASVVRIIQLRRPDK